MNRTSWEVTGHGAAVVAHRAVACTEKAPSRPATHEHAVLCFYVGGSAIVEQRGRHTLGAGDVLVIPAGEPHRVLTTQSAELWGLGLCIPCLPSQELKPLLAPFERVRSGGSAVVTVPSGRHEHLVGLFRELGRETIAPPSPASKLVVQSLVALILAEVLRAQPFPAPGAASAGPPLVAEALDYIEKHCMQPISLADVAAAVRRSPAHVTTALRRATGKTAGEWIVAGRVAEAERLLVSSDERIDIVAERVGYADPTHFIRIFRRARGMTPAAFRAAHRRGAS
ncbi:AraC family transcriptional regulator [Polyangium jinanense]|uniref:Helix-turn-helix domain-containing protein n=1 Tax=Polyangium jinanense TaxID=2829994 RepID=A0A9X3XF99_9BACT|nr:AraC family transcriptional regulator [Polyangium jinanense]MDC3962952.1 helix-turn-helix domain-containing protein [Polyangium jinanense]MDC3989559.1 helix-turn-helix domain-containing protein [Polyangium jinanense]